MNLSNQKLAMTGFIVAATCTILGRINLANPPLRNTDVLMVFGGGFVAGLSVVRFFSQWRAAKAAEALPAASLPPPLPPSDPAPRSKS